MSIFTRKMFLLALGLTSGLMAMGLDENTEEATDNNATPAADSSKTLPLLNFQIGDKTNTVNLINTNNDPFVFTKVYKLKYADPYEIRPYIMSAVRSRRVTANSTKVEAIKYMDGTGMLIVSAEDYRFAKSDDNVMSIDELIEAFDRPSLSSENGRNFFVYYAKYFDSDTLAGLIKNVGTQHALDVTELTGGIDTVKSDLGVNALFFYTTPASAKNINTMLQGYDGPATEAEIRYTIYEVYSENDGSLGVDFQAWKNGMGSDLFAAGASYLSGLPVDATNVVKDAHANFINFNPRWNSKFLDFLVSKSEAKVVTSGTLSIMNKCEGLVESTTSFQTLVDGVNPEDPDAGTTYQYRTTSSVDLGFNMTITPEVNGKASILSLSMSNSSLVGFKSNGEPRTNRTELTTKLMVGNDYKTFYVGGLDKSDLVRSVSKVPFLGDIPYIGFLFSAETEQIKKSSIVAVIEVKGIAPTTVAPAELLEEGKAAQAKVDNYGIKGEYIDENEYGFDQFGNKE